LVGLLAIALAAGSVVLTGLFLTGKVRSRIVPAAAEFSNCGQGLRKSGDVKLRGVLVGRIGRIELDEDGTTCRVNLDLFPADVDLLPQNVEAQIRAKTIFGEKWVELIIPSSPSKERFAAGDVIPEERTIDPLEVETILNVALPLLEAIDPENLAGALEALAGGFVGHEDAAIRGINQGIAALEVPLENQAEFKEGIDQLAESGAVLEDVDDDLLQALENLDRLNRFTVENSDLIAESLNRAPILLRELSTLFETRFGDLVNLANSGATVLGIVAARTSDLDKLLDVLPKFNSAWIRNLGHVCRFRQATDEPGKAAGDRVPGRCWRVHNLTAESRGAYPPGKEPKPNSKRSKSAPRDLRGLMFAPAEAGVRG
jgi:phospholipid/cholesterol/gamma-HCH transport system substrate-binding protein